MKAEKNKYEITYENGSKYICWANGFWEAEITGRDDEFGLQIVSIEIIA